jgi:hypothetical protein
MIFTRQYLENCANLFLVVTNAVMLVLCVGGKEVIKETVGMTCGMADVRGGFTPGPMPVGV